MSRNVNQAMHKALKEFHVAVKGKDRTVDFNGRLSQRGRAIVELCDWFFWDCFNTRAATESAKGVAFEHIPKLRQKDWDDIKSTLLAREHMNDENRQRLESLISTLDTLYSFG